MTTVNNTASAIQDVWLNGTDEECREIGIKMASALGCSVYDLMSLLTNLDVVTRCESFNPPKD